MLLEPGGRQIWTYTDLLGNAAWTVAGQATSPGTTLYDPFGQPITQAHGTHAQVTDPARAAFEQIGWGGGQTLNLRTPLMTMGARTYAPAAGRFLQPDPQVSSTNAYEFADSDPVNVSDVSGALPEWLVTTLSTLVTFVVTVAVGAATAGLGVPAAAAIGAVAGAAVQAGLSVAVQSATVGFDNISWGEVGLNAGLGALSGLSGGAAGAKLRLAIKAKRAAAAASQYDLLDWIYALERVEPGGRSLALRTSELASAQLRTSAIPLAGRLSASSLTSSSVSSFSSFVNPASGNLILGGNSISSSISSGSSISRSLLARAAFNF
ncbi:MAG: RHS repeat-associated core domain-containing protein [Streptosporangiales bacterium]